jgi:hypothetical protein
MKKIVLVFCLMGMSSISSALCVLAGEFTGLSYLKGSVYMESGESFDEQIFRIETTIGSPSVSPSELFCSRTTETSLICENTKSPQGEVNFEAWVLDITSNTVIFTQNRLKGDGGTLSGGKMMKGEILGTCI